jgi:pyruvate-formate lyase-activating enzyme
MNTVPDGPAPFALETLALLPTWECDVACQHCVFSSSPAMKGRLAIDAVAALVPELRRISSVQRVVVSGGEAFLDFDYLLQVARITAAAGLAFRVVTNGSFAESDERATSMLKALKDIGLETVGLSWDDFHARFIEPERARTLLRCARKLGITVRITVVVTKTKTLDSAVHDLGEEGFEVPLTQVRCLPVGRANRLVSPDELLAPAAQDQGRACKNDFDTLAVTHDGSAYPCCAVGGFTPGLKLGSILHEPVSALLRRRDTDLRWVVLASQGPEYFLRFAGEEERRAAGVEAGSHDCVKCHRMFSTGLGEILVGRAKRAILAQADKVLAAAREGQSDAG